MHPPRLQHSNETLVPSQSIGEVKSTHKFVFWIKVIHSSGVFDSTIVPNTEYVARMYLSFFWPINVTDQMILIFIAFGLNNTVLMLIVL